MSALRAGRRFGVAAALVLGVSVSAANAGDNFVRGEVLVRIAAKTQERTAVSLERKGARVVERLGDLGWQRMSLPAGKTVEQAIAEFSAGILRGRAATPEDIAGSALFLASPESDYMTGQIIMIDGGMVLI